MGKRTQAWIKSGQDDSKSPLETSNARQHRAACVTLCQSISTLFRPKRQTGGQGGIKATCFCAASHTHLLCCIL